MKKNLLFIGLIPAKKKSRGLKNKNLRKINGKSLTEITVSKAVKSRYLDKIYLSTNSKKISLLSKKYKVNLLKRPNKLCKDTTESREVISHFIKNLPKEEKNLKNVIVYLQPTSPLRTNIDIDKAIKIYLKSKQNSLISVSKLESKFLKFVELKKNYLKIFNKDLLTKNRQELENFYYLDGFIFIFQIRKFLTNKFFLNNSVPYFTNSKKSLDIDNYSNYKMAKNILEK
jgi:N-acylneuraminate cytidylyltransferase